MKEPENQIKLHIEPYAGMTFRDFAKSMEGLAAFMDSQVGYTSEPREKAKLYAVNHGSIEMWVGFGNALLTNLVTALLVELIKCGVQSFIAKHRSKYSECKKMHQFLKLASKGSVITIQPTSGDPVVLNKEKADALIVEIKSLKKQTIK